MRPLALFAVVVAVLVLAQSTESRTAHGGLTKLPIRSKEWKIQNAMSAAPRAVASGATIIDYPEREGGEPAVLREGRNDWLCFPDNPASPGNDPMCMDKMAMQWAEAVTARADPNLTTPGIGYMLQGGSSPSNTDPFATEPAAGEKWLREPPHIMLFTVGKLDPRAYATDSSSGKPWLMFAGTPYEHLMIPVK